MTQKVVKKQKKKLKIEEVIRKGKQILLELNFTTFNRYREIGKLILNSGYRKHEWHSEDKARALEEWHISDTTFKNMVALGEMINEEFDNAVVEFPSYHAWANRHTILKLQERERLIRELRERAKGLSPPDGKFDVIVVDPPWPYNTEYHPESRRGACPYPEMDIEEIKNINLPADENCVLWLWTTNAFIHDALHVIGAWGFEPKTILTWVKDKFGVGYWLRGQTEHCVLGVRGHPLIELTNQTTVIHAKRREHSEKPDEFYDLVDSLCLGRKLDYFGTKDREGWHIYGTLERNKSE